MNFFAKFAEQMEFSVHIVWVFRSGKMVMMRFINFDKNMNVSTAYEVLMKFFTKSVKTVSIPLLGWMLVKLY